jgi:hypothetical protein
MNYRTCLTCGRRPRPAFTNIVPAGGLEGLVANEVSWVTASNMPLADVCRTYSTAARGVDWLVFVNSILDLTPYGRQQDWEDSPPGWPQRPAYGEAALPAASWGRQVAFSPLGDTAVTGRPPRRDRGRSGPVGVCHGRPAGVGITVAEGGATVSTAAETARTAAATLIINHIPMLDSSVGFRQSGRAPAFCSVQRSAVAGPAGEARTIPNGR